MSDHTSPTTTTQGEGSIQDRLMLELSVLSELKKSAFLATKALDCSDHREGRSLRLDANGAYSKALRILTQADGTIADPLVNDKLTHLRELLRRLSLLST